MVLQGTKILEKSKEELDKTLLTLVYELSW